MADYVNCDQRRELDILFSLIFNLFFVMSNFLDIDFAIKPNAKRSRRFDLSRSFQVRAKYKISIKILK